METDPRLPDPKRLSSGVTVGDVGGNIAGSYFAGRDIHITAPLSPSQMEELHNRRSMLDLVKHFWVHGVLEQSLHGVVRIELGFEERSDVVDHPWDSVLQLPDVPSQALAPGTSITEVFVAMHRALLILGEPGAGKTTLLLELARALIEQAEHEPTLPIPVVFNLSSWRGNQTIADWLVDELNGKYNIPRKIGRPWVDHDALLLLLDGLDEVKAEYREACIHALNDFRQSHFVAMVVCSRRADYEALRTPLKLTGAITVQPLTLEQVDRYLLRGGEAVAAVRTLLHTDHTLQELVQSPLMLSIVMLAYREIPVAERQTPFSPAARHIHLFDAYLRQMFKRRGVEVRYGPTQTVHWLSWLAQQMTRHTQSVFMVEQLQPTWLPNRLQRGMYAVASRSLALVITYLACISITFSLPRPLSAPLFILSALLLGGMIGLVDALRLTRSNTQGDAAAQRRPGLGQRLKHALSIGLVTGLFNGFITWRIMHNDVLVAVVASLTTAVTAGLIFGRGYGVSDDIQMVESLQWSWQSFLKNARAGFTAGAGLGVLSGLYALFNRSIDPIPLVPISSLWAIGVWALFFGLLFGLILGLIGKSARAGFTAGAVLGVLAGVYLLLNRSTASTPVWFLGSILSIEIAVLFFGLLFGLILGLIGGLHGHSLEAKARPGQGLGMSMRHAVFSGLTYTLLIGALVGSIFGVFAGTDNNAPAGSVYRMAVGLQMFLALGSFYGGATFLWFGGLDFIKHYVLRVLLSLTNTMPLRYIHFLDYTVTRIFLHKVGGGYIFVHRQLLEYFAALDPASLCEDVMGGSTPLTRTRRIRAGRRRWAYWLRQTVRQAVRAHWQWHAATLLLVLVVVITVVSDQPQIHFYYGQYSAKNNKIQAIASYTRALELDPTYAEAYDQRGWIYYNQGVAVADTGKTEQATRSYDRALADYSRALMLNDRVAAIHYRQGLVYSERVLITANQEDTSQALENYSRAIALNYPLSGAYYRRGNIYLDSGNWDKAIPDYTAAVQRNPKLVNGYGNRGLAYLQRGWASAQSDALEQAQLDYSQAIDDFDRANQLAPALPYMYFYRGMAFSDRGRATINQDDYRQALDNYTRAIALQYSPLGRPYMQRGWTYAHKEAWDQAISDYTKAIELDPNMVRSYVRRGQAYYKRGVAATMAGNASQARRDNQQALDDYNRALEFKDAPSDIYIARASAQATAGNLDQALRDATIATARDPGNAGAWADLCWFGALWGHATDVIDACDRAVTLAPANANFRDSRGVARALLGNYTGAMEDFSVFLQWTKANYRYERYGVKREGWLKELQTGHNPFDQQALEALRNE